MRLLERVLVALDFGPGTDAVVAAATALAKRFSSEVCLLHVLPQLDEAVVPDLDKVLTMARQGALSRLAEVRGRLQAAEVSTGQEQVADGIPFDRIIAHAEDLDANVIVVGAHSGEAAGGARLGMTAERLCRKSSKPVLVVHPESPVEPKTILCPVDGSAPSKRALRNAIHLARRFDAQLQVLHVIPPISVFPGLIPSVQLGMERKHMESETPRFEAFLKEFDFHGITWNKVVREGAPAEVILQVVSELSADLVIMGSVGRTGLSRILLGSVAGKVARQLPCSVVMMKAEDAIRLKLDQDLSDLSTHYARAGELLENGFVAEAKRHFEHCVQTSDMFAPAWLGLAEACERQGQTDLARKHRETARQIEETLAWRRVEADIRRRHPLWTKS